MTIALAASPWTAWRHVPSTASTKGRACSSFIPTSASIAASASRNVRSGRSNPLVSLALGSGWRTTPSTPRYCPTSRPSASSPTTSCYPPSLHGALPTSANEAARAGSVTYVVNDDCIRCKYMDCVEVCPVDCFYEGENMLVIHPDECIDCGVCEPECPVDAIKPDSEPGLEKWLALNAE